MNTKSIISNASVAFLAQGVSVALGVVQSLLVPKLLGGESYGYWQLFLFYTSYIGFFHLGINDGVYLIHGGEERTRIDKRAVFSQLVFATAYQLLFALGIIAVGLLGGFGAERRFVIVSTAAFMVPQNAANFLAYTFQAMNETKRASAATIIERLTFLVPLACLLVGGVTAFEPYIVAYVFSMTVQLAFCLWHARDFAAAGFVGWGPAAREGIASIRVGIKLMLANIASQLILGLARGAIDAAWGIESFGKLSLLLSIVSFFLLFVGQASMVLFPALRQSGEEELRGFFRAARDIMGLFMPLVYLAYAPIVWLLTLWLPAFAESFTLLALLLPICVFESKMDICCTTFFKVRRRETMLLAVNVATALLSLAGTALGVWGLNSINVVIGGVVVAIAARSLFSERYIGNALGVDPSPIAVGELVITGAFIVAAHMLPMWLACGAYLLVYLAFLWVFRARAAELWESARKL